MINMWKTDMRSKENIFDTQFSSLWSSEGPVGPHEHHWCQSGVHPSVVATLATIWTSTPIKKQLEVFFLVGD